VKKPSITILIKIKNLDPWARMLILALEDSQSSPRAAIKYVSK
jgi:hypothetical protein